MKPILLSAAVALAGCGVAAMNQVSLGRDCSTGDAGCHRVGPLAPLAVGAVFHPSLAAELAGTTTPILAMSAVDASILEVDRGALIGRAPGVTAVMIALDSGVVLDFMHVWVAQPTQVTVERDTGDRVTGGLDLVPGEELRLVPAVWAHSQRLEGATALAWSLACTGPCPIALLRDGTPHRRRLRAQRAGTATIVVAGLGLRETIDVEVVP